MWHLLHFTVYTVLMFTHGAKAHMSFRIADMARGFDVNNTDPEVLGGTAHDCYRTCVDGDVRTCSYSFTVVEYTTMSRLCGNCPYTLTDCYNTGCITAGGDTREVILANHMLPGPSIQVCEGDVVQVNVMNALSSASTTIHWHGIYQLDTPYMDGTPYLTQCPIQPHNSFQYNFTAEPVGTHIWHSHSGICDDSFVSFGILSERRPIRWNYAQGLHILGQRINPASLTGFRDPEDTLLVGFEEADGLHGSFIVRTAEDPLSEYYDYDLPEHIMAIWHWYYSSTASVLKSALHRNASVIGYSLTVNGLAATVKFEQNDTVYMTPRAEFNVAQGLRYRFRLLYNSALYCPVQVSIDNHTLLVIASEAGTFEPVEVDSLIINAGERYDVVLTADQEIANYWIRYRGMGDCLKETAAVYGEAILRYNGSNDTADPSGTIGYDDANRSGVLLNPVQVANNSYIDNTLIYVVDLNSTVANQANVSGTPDHIIYMHYAYNYYYEFHSPGPFPQVNYASFEFPPIPLLTQYDEITDDMYCTEEDDTAKDCVGTYCTCPYIYAVNTNSLVEVIVIDLGLDRYDDHPMHLHGHTFQVVAMESIGGNISLADVQRRNEAGLIEKKLDGAPVKDNIGIPAQGFAVLRFIASNPGYWFFHCHISNHAEMGMGIVIKVGEHNEMIQPPDSFPTCGHWDMTKISSSSYSSVNVSNINLIIFLSHLVIIVVAYMPPLAFAFEN